MKHLILAVPAALLLASAAVAQTDTTATTEAATGATAGGEFGTNWPLSVSTTFFTDADSATLRSADELSKGWQSLSPEDQTMIRTDCQAFTMAHGEGSADASTGTATGDASTTTSGTASTDTATTGTASTDTTASGTAATDTTTSGTTSTDTTASTDTTGTGTASSDASTGTTAATTAPAGFDMAEMKAICEAVGSL